eukprot:gene34536-44298_t
MTDYEIFELGDLALQRRGVVEDEIVGGVAAERLVGGRGGRAAAGAVGMGRDQGVVGPPPAAAGDEAAGEGGRAEVPFMVADGRDLDADGVVDRRVARADRDGGAGRESRA